VRRGLQPLRYTAPMRACTAVLPLLLLTFASGACASASGAAAGNAKEKAAPEEAPVPVGTVTREQVEEAAPEWVAAEVEAVPDEAAAHALAAVTPGAEVKVFLGTWCGDSRREVPRLWKALDLAGAVPFAISYVGVDREKKDPAGEAAGADVRYVPTFIVRRDGREVGRIVESAPQGVERDLLSLLDGSAQGLITGRDDLGGGAPQP
jgi:thiol-disulfide isomerase/thioredoxin